LSESRLRTISEAVGLVAVVASLIFVGFEIRQNAAATRAATVESINAYWLEWNLAMIDPAVWAGVERVWKLDDPTQARPVDLAAAGSVARGLFGAWANAHHQYRTGHLDDAWWDATARQIRMHLDGSFGTLWQRFVLFQWGENKAAFPVALQTHVDSVIRAVSP
jgi:hypothetical protein